MSDPVPDDSPPFPWRRFAHPRYWPTWLGLALLKGLFLIPLKSKYLIGRGIGQLAFKLLKRRVHIARVNIGLCFPDHSDTEKEALLKAHFEAVGIGIIETSLALWASDEQISELAHLSGLEHLQQAKTEGKGVILVTGHFTMMELCMHMLSAHHRVGAMYRPMKNRLMDELLLRARARRMSPLFTREETRNMARLLRKGEAICYAYDQNYGIDHGAFIPFFGVPAATITTTSRFAAMGKAVVMPIFPKRLADGRYEITILPPLDNFPSKDDETDTQRINKLLETAILEVPEQYFWLHRCFRTRPPGHIPIY